MILNLFRPPDLKHFIPSRQVKINPYTHSPSYPPSCTCLCNLPTFHMPTHPFTRPPTFTSDSPSDTRILFIPLKGFACFLTAQLQMLMKRELSVMKQTTLIFIQIVGVQISKDLTLLAQVLLHNVLCKMVLKR